MGNGTLKGTIVKGSAGGSGGGTAATTSFEPTATIDATNVQDAIEEVDAKAEAVAGDLSDTEINGVAIAGKHSTCDDLGLQCKLTESNSVSLETTSVSQTKLLIQVNATSPNLQDVSENPLSFEFTGTSPQITDGFFTDITKKSYLSRNYAYYGVKKPSGADWSKLNFGLKPFTYYCIIRSTNSSNNNITLAQTPAPFGVTKGRIVSNGSFIIYKDPATSGDYVQDSRMSITNNVVALVGFTRKVEGGSIYRALWEKGSELSEKEYSGLQGVAIDFSNTYNDGILSGSYGETKLGAVYASATGEDWPDNLDDFPIAGAVKTTATVSVPQPANFTQIASKTCTSTSETSLIDDTGAKGTNVILANRLQVGDVIMLDIEGQISALLDATPTVNIKYGSAVLATLAKAFSVASSSVHFHIKAMATIRSIGASGKAVCSGEVLLKSYSAESGGITWPLGGISEVAIDTTMDNALDATVAWSAEDAGNTITASQFVISSLLR